MRQARPERRGGGREGVGADVSWMAVQFSRKLGKATGDARSHRRRRPISPSNRPASVTHSASLREAPPRHHPVMDVIAQHPGLPVKYEPRHWRSEAILRATMVPNPTRPKAGGLRLLLGPRQRHILHSLDTSSSMN